MNIVSVISLDNNLYAVLADSYTRSWIRQFFFSISAVVTRVNFVDRGPGTRKYNMTLLLMDWPTDSLPYKQGVTANVNTQRTNLEASYNKIATVLGYTDPFGLQPIDPRTNNVTGVYFTNMTQSIPRYAVPNKVAIEYQIELADANAEQQ